jgi:hypothetical protein
VPSLQVPLLQSTSLHLSQLGSKNMEQINMSTKTTLFMLIDGIFALTISEEFFIG